jgi:hypothetical protein
MTRPHWHTHRDRNQSVIEDALRQCGAGVYDISAVPDSQCPGDLLIYWRGQWQVFEVKRPGAPVSDQQQYNHDNGTIPIARCTEDILRWYGVLEE